MKQAKAHSFDNYFKEKKKQEDQIQLFGLKWAHSNFLSLSSDV
jgi:hypothetical protein